MEYERLELRLNLILHKIDSVSIRKKLFEDYEDEDSITIHELSRLFKRKPLKCTKDTLKLARYLIEPQNTITFNQALEANIVTVTKRIQTLINNYNPFIEEDKIKQSLKEVIIMLNSRN